MREDIVAVVLLFLKVYVCRAENVIVGSTKQLVCQIQNGNNWEKFSHISSFWETIHNGGRYSGAYASTLTIRDFQIEDSGDFRCKVDGTDSNGAIIVLKPEIQGSIGSSVTLQCTVSGTSLYWYKIGTNGATTISDNHEYEGSTTNSLKIKSLTTNTAVIYYCQLTNGYKGHDITVSISVDGGWSLWGSWGDCTLTCGTGQQSRSRTCDNPAPQNNGADCPEQGVEYDSCTLPTCPVDGAWSSWDSWGACSVTCGTGQHRRRHSCNNPVPANGGAFCPGVEYDYNSCTQPVCPVNGGWSSWISGACNVTCGTGQQSRRRYCNNPLKGNSGDDCQGEEYDLITCERSECTVSEQQSGNIPIVVGTVIGVIVIVILILPLVMYAKRRRHNSKKEPDYEITDMKKVKAHIYGETHVNHAYQNDQQTAEIEVTTTDNYSNEGHIVERYDVSDLTKRYQNREYFQQSLLAEFKLLNDSADNPKQLHSYSPYEIVNTGLRQDVNKLYLDSSALDVICTNNVSIVLELPQQNLAEQLWTIVDNQCIENIVLLANGNEKMSEFYPILDDILRINNFEIYLDSAERMNKNIMLLTLNLQNKTTQSIRQIRMFKTNVSEYPTVQTLCFLVDKASEIRGAPVLIINSKMADLSVCGVLAVCLNVIYAIKNGSPFSVLENAMVANKNNRRIIKNFDDYGLCYKVMEYYLEAVHTYAFIE